MLENLAGKRVGRIKIYVYPQHKAGHLGAEESEKGVKAAVELRLLLENRR